MVFLRTTPQVMSWNGNCRKIFQIFLTFRKPIAKGKFSSNLCHRTRCSVQLSSVTQLCPTLCHPMDYSTPGFPGTSSWSLLKLMSIESVMPSNHLILCHPLLLPPSIFPSIRVFSGESTLHIRWPEVSASASVLPMNIQD